jgi:hypothetical protein
LETLDALGAFEAVVRGDGAGFFADVAFATTRAAFGSAACLAATGAGADAARGGAFTAAASGGFAAVWAKAVVALAFAGLLGALVPAAGAAFLAASASGCEAGVARLAPGLEAAFGDVFVAMVKLGCVVGIGLVRPQQTAGNNTARKNGKSRTQTSHTNVVQKSCTRPAFMLARGLGPIPAHCNPALG